MVLLKEPEALLVVIISKNSNSLHFAIYTTCMPSCRFNSQLDKPLATYRTGVLLGACACTSTGKKYALICEMRLYVRCA